jgi:uncharacterized membrane protein
MSELSDYISVEDEKELVEAIKRGEKETSGEIRVHIELDCSKTDPYQRALDVFEWLEMHKTELSNGILIYLAIQDHKVVVCGDKGINDIVGKSYWEETIALMVSYFKVEKYKEGLIKGIEELSLKLKTYFPYQKGDSDELSNEISK